MTVRPCWACGSDVEPWPCLECKGPDVVLACEKCHQEVRHGATPHVAPVHFAGGWTSNYKGDPGPAWENMVRALEG